MLLNGFLPFIVSLTAWVLKGCPHVCSRHQVWLQALEILADFGKPAPGQSQQHLWYNNPELAMSASSAGSYLIDLLHMRVLHLSPLAISAPQAFLQACSGMLAHCLCAACSRLQRKVSYQY